MAYSENELREICISRRDIYEGRVFHAHVDEVSLPNGSTSTREIVDHNGGVCVAAFNEKGEVAMVRQFRYPYGETLSELPAGKLEKGENPDEAICRELMEEVGAEGENWRSMGLFYPTPGYCSEVIHLYTCDVKSVGAQNLDEDEFLNAEFVPLEKVLELIMNGTLKDGKTQTLIMKCVIERGKIS